jgi:hypothetical protein
MKTYRMFVLQVLIAAIANPVFAAPGSVLSDKVHTKPTTGPARPAGKGRILNDNILTRNPNSPSDGKATTGGVTIRSFTATRGTVIRVEGKLENSGLATSQPITCTLSSRANEYASWSVMQKSQQKPIGAGKTATIRFAMLMSTKPIQFKLEISPGLKTTAQCALMPDITYVVRYTTSGNWVDIKRWPNDLSDTFYASEMARLDLKPVGVMTRISKKKTTEFDFFGGGFNARLDTTLQGKTDEKLEQTFPTKAEAENFRDSLVKLTKDAPSFTVESVGERY